ncbi:MAG: TetR family transcriptional regulator [Acidobacteriia bacterium]|nr:TetR family transcriptional regulator [Terriglobia bacterium]
MIPKAVDTKTRILDAAEKLFGKNGFDATSLRDITAEASVNLAAVNYHFQSKDSLIDAVIARRVEPVNQRRLEMLEAAGENPTLEQLLIAFLQPLMQHDFSVVYPLMARVLATPDTFVTHLLKRHLGLIIERFGEAFGKALPEFTETQIRWKMHFTAGAMAHVLSRAYMLPELMPDTKFDCQTALAELVTFAAAGFRAKEGI